MLLRRRLVLLFAAVLFAVLVVGAVSAVFIVQRDNTRATERRLSIAEEQATQLSAASSDEETGARGFVLSGDERFLEPFGLGTRNATRIERSLRAIAADEHAIRPPLTRALRAIAQWRDNAALPAIDLRQAGQVAGATATLTAPGAALFDTVHARLATLVQRVNNAAAVAEDRASDARKRLTVVVVVALALAAVGALLASLLIGRWVTRPLADLGEQIRRTRSGESEASIRVPGPPEIAQLAADVDAMRRRIEDQRAQAQRSRLAVERSAAVLLTLRGYLEPEPGPLPGGWTVAAKLRAAEGVVAGDCYDIVPLDEGSLGLVVVDISGHGPAEGILALRCKELLRAALSTQLEPGAALVTAADQLGELGEEVFLTAFVATVDTRDGKVRYANAGHPPAFITREDAHVELAPTGPLVGLIGTGWDTKESWMEPGDSLCAYTDGIIEVRNAQSVFYGPERLTELVRGSRCEEAPAIVKRCLDDVQTFAAGSLRDDATIVILCRPDG
jgi:sigma-B regulation protein RsbU (phosphoserine phosphatase)